MAAHGMPLRIVITEGTCADCTQAGTLIEGIDAQYLLPDKGYDSDAIVEQTSTARHAGSDSATQKLQGAKKLRQTPVQILPSPDGKRLLDLKRWRGIVTRYAKNAALFLAAVQIRCLVFWLNIS